jgi:hypothetical protein
MSSSIDLSSMTIEQLNALKTQYDSEIKSRGKEASSGKVVKTKRAGSERGTAWASFTQKVIAEHQEEFAAFKEAAEVKQGVAPKFVSHYRSTHEAEWEAYSELWKRENPIASENASVASGGSAEPAAKKSRAKKVAKNIEGQVTHFEELKEKKKRGPKKASSSAEAEVKAAAPVSLALPVPAPVAAPAPAASEEAEEGVELLPFVLDGQTYLRPKSGDEWASGDLWYTTADGSKGGYLGELMDDGSINTDAEEPEIQE